MTTKKRIISVLLLASLLLSVTSCGTDNGKVSDDTTVADTTSAADTLPAGIEKQDYNGTVNILIPDWSLYTKCFDPGDDMTDVLNKALYNRELKVEEYLGVNITYEHIPEGIAYYYDKIVTAVSTNDDLYQILLSHCIQDNAKMATGGYLTDMNNLGIDFTADWFNQTSNEALEVDGKQFFCVSDYMLPDPNAFLFNKELIEKNNLEDPYQLVRDGKWTIDKLAEMASAVTADNGDTIWDAKDTYGFSCPDNWYSISFIYGADVDIISKNSDGEFEIVFDDERTYTMMEKLDALINSPDTLVFASNALSGNEASREKAVLIESGRCLFTLYTLNQLYTIRNVETDFGILPYPKLDESQENYISNDWTGLTCIPMSLSVDSYKMVGDVIELLAYYSEEDVIPAYIDITLGTKLARDPDSKEMINLIFDTCSFNAGMNYFAFHSEGPMKIYQSVHDMLYLKGENTLSSWIATYGSPSEAVIEDFNNTVRALNDK